MKEFRSKVNDVSEEEIIKSNKLAEQFRKEFIAANSDKELEAFYRKHNMLDLYRIVKLNRDRRLKRQIDLGIVEGFATSVADGIIKKHKSDEKIINDIVTKSIKELHKNDTSSCDKDFKGERIVS